MREIQFLREEWTLYGVGAAVLLLRFAIRIKTVGFKGFQGDDYMSILVLALFTMDAATVHIICKSSIRKHACSTATDAPQDHTGTNVEASALQQTRSENSRGLCHCSC